MTDQTPLYVPAPAQQNPYPVRQSAPKKPPLSRELKRSASVAGAVRFTVMSIGWGLLSTAVMIGALAGFLAWMLEMIDAPGSGQDAGYFRLMDLIEEINPAAWVVPLVIAGFVGIGLWVLSLFISRGMLARAKHPSLWGVTWAGAGVAIVASWLVSWVAWLPVQFAGLFAQDAFTTLEGGIATTVVLAIVAIVLNIAITAVIGWLAWWWMAHVMRPAALVG